MKDLIRGELTRLFSTRLPRWAAIAAIGSGGGLTGILALTGPENASPPMPGIDTPEGAGLVLSVSALLLFVPALFGTIAITSEYRHRTIGTTFLAVPRRARVLVAKLVVYGAGGFCYGLIASATAGLALLGAAAVRGVTLALSPADLLLLLAKLAVVAAVYVVIGVGIGALARHQLVAVGIVLGYFYFLEYVLMIVPGVNRLYPFLPGGATSSLTTLTVLTDTIADQTSGSLSTPLAPVPAAFVLLAYAAVASVVAAVVPLRRDLT
ncbi:ABC-2 family transporter [Kribbella amoyensis]|uniref:ABC-2 family transporter n=1 Tax=Kribbella amoyensis TaxID=996641 RepID=A0A561BZR3_9ACTN|nr:ABC transporter permease subunit [Kribbella amoyensis]TWD84399.1 ABC-2 family transporter [Kribbella amoyensis]